MKIHCNLNKKAVNKKSLNVEFIFNGGYWSKWYVANTTEEAKELFLKEYPNSLYCRTKKF